jgi:hypothetical protein
MKISSHHSYVIKNESKLEISTTFLVTTRQQRRKALKILTQLIQIVLAAEKRYIADMHVNQLSSSQYDEADHSVSVLSEALDILEDVY